MAYSERELALGRKAAGDFIDGTNSDYIFHNHSKFWYLCRALMDLAGKGYYTDSTGRKVKVVSTTRIEMRAGTTEDHSVALTRGGSLCPELYPFAEIHHNITHSYHDYPRPEKRERQHYTHCELCALLELEAVHYTEHYR